MSQINDRLYKFVASASSLHNILRGELKFTPPIELNDPAELSPFFCISSVQASLEELRRRGHSDREFECLIKQGKLMQILAPEFQAIPLPQTAADADLIIKQRFYDDIERLRGIFVRMVEVISTRVGVFCLTGNPRSLLMWAHYSSAARGLLIEFHRLNDHFRGDDTSILNEVSVVNYKPQLSGVTFFPESYRNFFFDKYVDWAYEAESRVVSPLSQCHKTNYRGKEVYIRSVPSSVVAAVIVGWRATDETKTLVDRIVRDARLRGWDGKVLTSRFQNGEVDIS